MIGRRDAAAQAGSPSPGAGETIAPFARRYLWEPLAEVRSAPTLQRAASADRPPISGETAWDDLRMRSRGSEERLSTLRVLGELRRAVRSNRRPMIAAEVARERYEPLIESLAGQLSMEFGVEWRRAEVHPVRRRRAFQTTRWVIDQPLTRFSEWERRLDTTVAQLFDIVGAGTSVALLDAVLGGLDDESATQAQAQSADQHLELDDVVRFEGENPKFLPLTWTVRDRMGGDINVTVHDDRTNLWATASVKPG